MYYLKKMNINSRALIYFLYNSRGEVPAYVPYQLEKFRPFCQYIVVVINGKVSEEGRISLSKVSDEVIERENVGLDVGAFKTGINYLVQNKLTDFDETLLVNFTCFGPIFPLEELFNWSQTKDCDFWSLTKDEKPNSDSDYLHKNACTFHYQSNFLALRKDFLKSPVFQTFLNEIPDKLTYMESGKFFEYAFPGYFLERGFGGIVYCDDKDLEYPLLHNPVRLLQKYRLPFIKVRSFFHFYTDTLKHDAGLATLFLMEYIKNKTDYPENLIWEYVLSEKNLAEILTACQLFFTLPKSICSQTDEKVKVGCVFHAYFEELFEEVSYYLAFVQKAGIDILITTNSDKKKELLLRQLEKNGISASVRVIPNRGRDVSALLVGASDFVFKHDIILFAHDKKSSQYQKDSVGRVWRTKLMEDTIGSECYLKNVIHLFCKNPKLGIAFPPYPRHSVFTEGLSDGWTGNYLITQKLLKSLGAQVKLTEHLRCIAPLGTCFWFRPEALKRLFNGLNGKGWNYSDFPAEPNKTDHTILHAIERCYCYIAQNEGYYSAFIQNDFMARNECINLEFNQTSFANNRYWINRLTAEATGQRASSQDPYIGINNDLSIKQNLILLAKAIRRKYPRAWRLALPARRAGQFLLRIKR